MLSIMEKQIKNLKEKANEVVCSISMMKANRNGDVVQVNIPREFREEFFKVIDTINLNLMEDKEHFYGYFLMQMAREIRFDIATPTAINFKGAKYIIYFNPIIFLNLTKEQMACTIKHEILHIVSMHLIRSKQLKGRYSTAAINMAMDIVVNKYLDYLPPYATTLEQVNAKYDFKLEAFESFEYYVAAIQTQFDLMEEDDEGEEDDSNLEEGVETSYDVNKTHDLWEDADIDEKTLEEFTQKFINQAQKGAVPGYLESLILALKNSKSELPWDVYLQKLMGTIQSNYKKVTTRRNRRQPERLDLRGTLRNHKAHIAVALDISGSISEEEFRQAMKEVLSIVNKHSAEITIIECDDQIRRIYGVRKEQDIKERLSIKGATKFTPVFEYANKKQFNLLIYFTDGKGEDKLWTTPKGYKVLWVISARGEKISLKEPYGAVKKLSVVEVIDESLDMRDVRNDGYSMNHQESML